MRSPWAEQLSHDYSDRYSVSLRPDLPAVLQGPDLLVARDGRLFAFFEPTTHERRVPVRLLARLMLSRLALPDHVRTVLLLADPLIDPTVVDDLRVHFHCVADTHVSSETIIRRARASHSRPVPKATRRYVQLQTAFLLRPRYEPKAATHPTTRSTDTDLRARLSIGQQELEPVELRELELQGPPRDVIERLPASILAETPEATYASGVITVRPEPHSSLRTASEEFKRYLPLVPLLTFSIDDGVPYIRRPFLGIFQPTDAAIGDAAIGRLRIPGAAAGWAIVRRDGQRKLRSLRNELTSWARNHV
jgi:hypothetical protein